MNNRFNFLVSLLIIPCFSLFSQFKESTLLVGGNADFGLEMNAPVGFQMNIQPNIGYFVMDNFVLGLQLDVGVYLGNDYTYTRFGMGPLTRYYLGNEKLSAFGHFSYIGRVTKSSYDEVGKSLHLFTPGIGMNINLSPNVGLESLLGLYIWGNDPTLFLRVGLQVFFPRKDD